MNFPLPKNEVFDRIPSVRGDLFSSHLLSDLTWFRVGGPAEILFQPADEEDLVAFLSQLPSDMAVLPIGLGSNLLVRDGGVDGVVIRLPGRGFGSVEDLGENRLRIGVAVPDKKIAQRAAELGIGGFAFYFGIPGCLGGALRMNAGAHGTETTDRVVEVRGVGFDGSVKSMSRIEMGFEYRKSQAPENLIFTSALLEGIASDSGSIRREMDEVKRHRETSQPIRERTSGSTFKNPEGDSAWKLIEKAGCRGLALGGAKVSEMHCNFLINTGNATATELEKLGETVRARVLADSGVSLEWEIKRVGKFPQGVQVQEFTEYCQ